MPPDAFFVEVAVDGGTRNLERVGDPLDGVFPCIVELLGMGGLIGGELPTSPSCFSAGPGRSEAAAGICGNEFALEFSENREHSAHRPTFRGRGVDGLLKYDQPYTPFSHVCAELD